MAPKLADGKGRIAWTWRVKAMRELRAYRKIRSLEEAITQAGLARRPDGGLEDSSESVSPPSEGRVAAEGEIGRSMADKQGVEWPAANLVRHPSGRNGGVPEITPVGSLPSALPARSFRIGGIALAVMAGATRSA